MPMSKKKRKEKFYISYPHLYIKTYINTNKSHMLAY